MLLDLGVALQSKQVTLPLDDDAQKPPVQMLKDQLTPASLKTTPSGRENRSAAFQIGKKPTSRGIGWAPQ